uniref:MYND-type domain-containing protein n=1 Tax=Strigamia maritima TaxID=126957 RepID=T1JK78_STRMM
MAFKKGDLILKSEPFAYVVRDEYRGRTCDNCLTLANLSVHNLRNGDLRRCTRCLFSYYCNQECQ